jgi:hypothetical protein
MSTGVQIRGDEPVAHDCPEVIRGSHPPQTLNVQAGRREKGGDASIEDGFGILVVGVAVHLHPIPIIREHIKTEINRTSRGAIKIKWRGETSD